MKAIIVIDLNDTTLNEWDTNVSKCWAKVIVNTPIKGGAHGIGCVYTNDNVELKPMPERFEPTIMTDYCLGNADGWNACLDEILGEIE